ncbi:MAG: type IV secretory system conjugative DNA transfer family protein [Cetobacterium sp.]
MDIKIKNRKFIEGTIIVILGFVIMCFVGTQFFAYKVNYSSTLNPIYKNYYFPFSIIMWGIKYKNTAPKLLSLCCSLMSVTGAIYSLIFYFILLKRDQKNTHGSAKFSTDKELKKREYLDKKTPSKNKMYKDGVILGRTSKLKTIIDSLATHILVIAPSRSGKGVGIILPTLVNWRNSVICFDIKGENFMKSSKFRQDKLNNKVLRLSPCDPLGASKYNPLKEIRIRTPYEVKDCEVIANILTAPEQGKIRDHFQQSANTVFSAIFLHLLYENENASLSDVYDWITAPNGTLQEKFSRLVNEEYTSDVNIIKKIYSYSKYKDGVHPIIVQGATELATKSEKELSSVISTAVSKLQLFKDPIVRNNTCESDFKLVDIIDSDTPVSLYFCAEMEDIDRLGIFIRIFLTQFMNITMRKEKHKHKCLMLLDEFPLYGRLENIENALGVIASYGIKIMLIAQNTEQIDTKYGKTNSIKQGCASTVFYAPNGTDYQTCKLISDILGNKTIDYTTSSGKKIGGIFEGNISNQKKARKLLEPEEVIPILGDDKNIIMLAGCPPTLGVKIRYFNEKYYDDKLIDQKNYINSKNWAKIQKIRRE